MKRHSPLCLMALLLLLTTPARMTAQATGTITRTGVRRTPDNVQAGTLAAADPTAGTVTLRPKAGPEKVFRLTAKTRLLREKKPADIAAFKVGDGIVVRFRRSSAGPADLYDLADAPSWAWIDRLRHDITPVTVKEMTEKGMVVTEGTDGAEAEYRVTEKTAWQKAGKTASPEDFKTGERIFVAPRMLPGGGLMAQGVADTAEVAARLRERARPTVTGTVTTCDLPKRALSLRSVAGDDRALTLAPDCAVRQSAKDVPLATLRPGQTVTAHIRRSADGEPVVTRITIQAKRAAPRSRR